MSVPSNPDVCVDSSIVVKLAAPEEQSEEVAELWEGWELAGVRILAPALIWYEVTSVIRNRHQRGLLLDEEATDALDLLLALPVIDVTGEELHRTAYRLAAELGELVTYDCHYLAVAVLNSCHLWTADRKMYRLAGQLQLPSQLIGPSA